MTGQELRVWRKTMGWTQQQAGDALGIGSKTIENYEAGERRVKGEMVPHEIPRYIALACAALFHRIEPVGG
jgi:transcriptional regulator with XRE-family HTH domain